MWIWQLTAPYSSAVSGERGNVWKMGRCSAGNSVVHAEAPREPSHLYVSIPKSGSGWHVLHHQCVLHNFPLVFQTWFTFFLHCNEHSFIRRVRRHEESKLLMIHELGANELEFYTICSGVISITGIWCSKKCNLLLMLGCRQLSAHAHFHT